MNQVTERGEVLPKDQEGEWKKKEEDIEKVKELKHGMMWEGNAEVRLSYGEKDQEQKVLARSTDVELNFDKIKDEAEVVRNS